ncbi:hypothetical protein AC1031_014908 [Aphanomyces cochlioides]|nr:hypothetical protein AC1031_014908 [Aphanomyces cochlioides]
MLAFINVDGLLEYYNTDGPGPSSVWILDGAAIHCDPQITHYLRSVGIVAIFLPAYCPFFNPIEFLFGYVKRAFQRQYDEQNEKNLLPFIARVFKQFVGFDMRKIFEHCGWRVQGFFDPVPALSYEHRTNFASSELQSVDADCLGFRDISAT